MPKRIIALNLALVLISISFFFAALQIPHIGEGAPDWHTVKRPQIPIESLSDGAPPPVGIPDEGKCTPGHPPIAVMVAFQVCVSEPVYGWSFNRASGKWERVCLGKHAVTKYLRKLVYAHWIDTLHCYAFYDDYGRLRLLPDLR